MICTCGIRPPLRTPDEPYRYDPCNDDCEVHVKCDDWCGALKEPSTVDELIAAHKHWKSHGYVGGCSHGC